MVDMNHTTVSIGEDRYLRQAVNVLNTIQIMKAKDKYCSNKT